MTVTTRIDVIEHRKPEHAIESLFWERWSPRAMSGEAIDDTELARLFEAARWAPSSYNRQPWRFLYAKRDGRHWQTFLDLLSDGNRAWAGRAAALVVIVSRRRTESGKPIRTHSFDAGAAWENLALQGASMGVVVHGMEGFDYERARLRLGVPEDYDVEAMAAIGLPGPIEALPEKQKEREQPAGRLTVEEIAIEGGFSE